MESIKCSISFRSTNPASLPDSVSFIADNVATFGTSPNTTEGLSTCNVNCAIVVFFFHEQRKRIISFLQSISDNIFRAHNANAMFSKPRTLHAKGTGIILQELTNCQSEEKYKKKFGNKKFGTHLAFMRVSAAKAEGNKTNNNSNNNKKTEYNNGKDYWYRPRNN